MAYLGQVERYEGPLVNMTEQMVHDPILGQRVPAWAYNHASVVPARRAVQMECQGSSEPPPDKYVVYKDQRTGEIVRAQWKDVPAHVKQNIASSESGQCRDARARYEQLIGALIRARRSQEEENRRLAEEAERRTRERVERERREAEEERRRMEREVDEENRRRREEAERRVQRGLEQALEEARRAREEAEAQIARTRQLAQEEARKLMEELQRVRGLEIEEQRRRMAAVEQEYARKRAQLEAREKALELQRKLAAQQEQQAAKAHQAVGQQGIQAASLFGGIDPTLLIAGAAAMIGLPLMIAAGRG